MFGASNLDFSAVERSIERMCNDATSTSWQRHGQTRPPNQKCRLSFGLPFQLAFKRVASTQMPRAHPVKKRGGILGATGSEPIEVPRLRPPLLEADPSPAACGPETDDSFGVLWVMWINPCVFIEGGSPSLKPGTPPN